MKVLIAAAMIVGAALIIDLTGAPSARADKAADKKSESLMRKKLEYSQRILEGLAIEDFDLVRREAERMQELARSKEFSPFKSNAYRAQFLIFDFANSELVRHAKEKNLDGAALAHTQLMLSCVACHKQLRDARK